MIGLRLRIVMTFTMVTVPLVAGVTWARGRLDERAAVERLRTFITARMEDGRANCERDPRHFPPPPPRRDRPPPWAERGAGGAPLLVNDDRPQAGAKKIVLFAYTNELTSANPGAIPFPPKIRAAFEAGASFASAQVGRSNERRIHVALRMPWIGGPCEVVMASQAYEAAWWLTGDQILTAGVLFIGLILAVLAAAGPMVARVRRLTQEVQVSASSSYGTDVTVTGNDELTQLSRAFNGAGAEVRRQLRTVEDREVALRRFVEDTTHDMMIPMTVLQGHLSALRAHAQPPVMAPLRGAMEEVHYINSLLANLAASAKLRGGVDALHVGLVDLNALAERVTARHAPIARERGVALDFSTPEALTEALGDMTLIEQAISNLIHNAVRYVPAGGHVALIVEADGPDAWRLRVIDDGPGIDDAQLTALTSRAMRGGEARSRYPEGQGLGLDIVREVARRHRFTFELSRSTFGGLEARLSGLLGSKVQSAGR